MITVLSVVGTRPEAIKMAPVILELQRYPNEIRSVLCATGQHREMLDQALALFHLTPDYDLNVMRPNQTLSDLTAELLSRLTQIVEAVQPDWILAQGDTTTVLVAALTAYYHKVRFGHVEAGLRTGDKYSPYPEEINRRIADQLADLRFAPTEHNRTLLLQEGYGSSTILVTGNTIVDALKMILAEPYDWAEGPLAVIPTNREIVVVTAHRRENFGEPLEQICLAIRDVATCMHPDVHFVFPVHYNPNVREVVYRLLGNLDAVSLLDPLDYQSMIHLLSRARLILTDSGGIQEEATSLGVPTLVMRETTERPEGLSVGILKLVGINRTNIFEEAVAILQNLQRNANIAKGSNLYGDGMAARRIVSALLEGDQVGS